MSICETCGKDFYRPPSTMKNSKHIFCSIACYGVRLKGGKRTVPPSQQRVLVPCDECGKELHKIPYRLKTLKHHFCNRKCCNAWRARTIVGENHPNWKGGYDYYGPNWKSQRRAARKRDNQRCQACGMLARRLGRAMDVHHITPFHTFKYIVGENERYKEANRLDNLISLCPSCHNLAERGFIPIQRKLC